jgi:hypothetical protein
MEKQTKIRQNVFETNSSSTHSVSINTSSNKEDFYATIELSPEGKLVLQGGDFGWGVESYTDALTKANYAYQEALDFPESNRLTILLEVLSEQTGLSKEDIILLESDGYIDHQSQGMLEDYFDSKDKLKEFIFNSNYELVIDNDNH